MSESHPVALVTGASRGIGAATARELGRRGYHVIVNYRRSADAARAVVDGIESSGGSAASMAADVCDPGQVQAMVSSLAAAHRSIDVLVCNANTVQPSFAALASLAWQDFIGKVTGELAGAFFITQHVLEVMRGQGRGTIVYVSSTSADYIGSGRICQSTAKSALNTFSRHVAAEAGPHGITVNTVAPGAVRTDATAGMLTAQHEEHLRGSSVLARMLEPEDVAAVIGLIVGEGMRAVTGADKNSSRGHGIARNRPEAITAR